MKKPSKELIDKVLNGIASQQEAAFVARWFATDEGQEYLNNDMDKFFEGMHSGSEELYVDHEIPSPLFFENKSREKQIPVKMHKNRLLLQVAAILLPLFILFGFLLNTARSHDIFGTSPVTEIYVPKGERMNITLPDGTGVFLNSDTKFSYPKKFRYRNRHVELLSGEAYFLVKKDAKRPFFVNMHQTYIEVLGTSFDVNAYENSGQIIVTLDEGRIKFAENNSGYHLYPKQQLLYDKQTGKAEIKKTENASLYSGWKNNILSFYNTPLQEVADILNRWFNVEFEIADVRALEYSFTLVSENEPLDTILCDLEKISPLRFKKENNNVIVTVK
jgi:ferric-dicitrate binding protein FerR (iron transport regulator)